MTHFDFKTLLPALLQVEDRVSMAHGLESRVPFLDHPLVDFAATHAGRREVQERRSSSTSCASRLGRRAAAARSRERHGQDGLPGAAAPVGRAAAGRCATSPSDVLGSRRPRARARTCADGFDPVSLIDSDTAYGRSLWGLLSLELWQREFHDRSQEWQALRQGPTTPYAASR